MCRLIWCYQKWYVLILWSNKVPRTFWFTSDSIWVTVLIMIFLQYDLSLMIWWARRCDQCDVLISLTASWWMTPDGRYGFFDHIIVLPSAWQWLWRCGVVISWWFDDNVTTWWQYYLVFSWCIVMMKGDSLVYVYSIVVVVCLPVLWPVRGIGSLESSWSCILLKYSCDSYYNNYVRDRVWCWRKY